MCHPERSAAESKDLHFIGIGNSEKLEQQCRELLAHPISREAAPQRRRAATPPSTRVSPSPRSGRYSPPVLHLRDLGQTPRQSAPRCPPRRLQSRESVPPHSPAPSTRSRIRSAFRRCPCWSAESPRHPAARPLEPTQLPATRSPS